MSAGASLTLTHQPSIRIENPDPQTLEMIAIAREGEWNPSQP
jgi:hypothetical protein